MLAIRSTLWLSNNVADWIFRKTFLLSCACIILFVLPAIYLVTARPVVSANDPAQVARHYLTALYARDYHKAYQWISAQDRKYKGETDYLRENPSFSGTALKLAYNLAGQIDWREFHSEVHGDRATVRLTVRLPDANAPAIEKLFLDFDPDRLAPLSAREIRAIEEALESMRKRGALPMIEGEESAELVQEQGRWRVYVNWAGAIRIRFRAEVKEGLPWKFWPVQETILAKPGETLQAIYKAKNLSDRPITAKARHRDEPRGLAEKYLETIQCFCFIQETLKPGEEKEFPLVLRVKQGAPNDLKEFRLTYEFYPLNKFPKKG